MVFILTHLLGIAGIAGALYATGWLIEVATGGLPVGAVGRFVMRIAAGSVAWIYILFLLAAVNGYRPVLVLPLMAAVPCAALVWTRARPIWRYVRDLTLNPRSTALGAVAALPATLIVAMVVVRASTLTIGPDDDVYHLVLPKLYVQHHGFVRLPFNVYSHWPHNVELLFGLAMMLDDYVLAKLVHTLYLALVLVAVYRITRVHCSRVIASLATVLVLGNDVLLYEAAVANIDIAFALYFLLAVACAEVYLRTQSRRALVWSGVFCGALAGTKLSGLAGLSCVAGLLFFRARGQLLAARYWREVALCLGLPALLGPLPWYIKTYLYTGNPVYPLFFRQLGGIVWSEQLTQQFFEWQQGMGMGRTLRDYALLPLRIVTDGAYGYPHFDGMLGRFWLLAVPLAILTSFKSKRGRSELIAAGLYFVFWALTSQQLRFFIAALPLLAIATSLALETLITRISWERLRMVLRGGALVATLATSWPMLRLTFEPAWEEATQLLERGPGERADVVGDGYKFLNEHAPPDARVLLIHDNRAFFLDREYIADSFPEASQISWYLADARTERELRAKFDELAVTHLYIASRRQRIALPDSMQALLEDPEQVKRVFSCKRRRCAIYALQ